MSATATPHLVVRFPFLILVAMLFFVGLMYWRLHFQAQQSLQSYFSERYGTDVSEVFLQEAILSIVRKLSLEADRDLEHIDISLDDYWELVREAEEKFGRCAQYRLIVLKTGTFPCFSCTSKANIQLRSGQTFKIGQTCNGEQSRYGSLLAGQNLKFFEQLKGSIFEVLVAEYIELKLFQYSLERQTILKQNHLENTEIILPPGNKITR